MVGVGVSVGVSVIVGVDVTVGVEVAVAVAVLVDVAVSVRVGVAKSTSVDWQAERSKVETKADIKTTLWRQWFRIKPPTQINTRPRHCKSQDMAAQWFLWAGLETNSNPKDIVSTQTQRDLMVSPRFLAAMR
jgi:hypothetical protein